MTGKANAGFSSKAQSARIAFVANGKARTTPRLAITYTIAGTTTMPLLRFVHTTILPQSSGTSNRSTRTTMSIASRTDGQDGISTPGTTKTC